MPTIALRPSANALRRAIAQTPPYRRSPVTAGTWEAGYQVLYRPIDLDRLRFAPSWCCLLVVPSEEERSDGPSAQ
jgi:hypothetical protein